jgi:Spy/CpxP family protein refolding chaperone
MNSFKLMHLSIALATVASSVALLAAEPDSEPRRRPGPPGGEPGRGQRLAPMQRPGGVPVEAVLNNEQRVQFREEMEAQRDKLRELEQKAAKLRRELDEALFSEKLDEKAVREKSSALAEVDAERSLIRARAFAKVRPSLSEEQLERLNRMRAEPGPGPGFRGGDFRPPREGELPPGDRGARPRRPNPPEDPGDVLPPPAPPVPPGPK